jgi:hypothetical protein
MAKAKSDEGWILETAHEDEKFHDPILNNKKADKVTAVQSAKRMLGEGAPLEAVLELYGVTRAAVR